MATHNHNSVRSKHGEDLQTTTTGNLTHAGGDPRSNGLYDVGTKEPVADEGSNFWSGGCWAPPPRRHVANAVSANTSSIKTHVLVPEPLSSTVCHGSSEVPAQIYEVNGMSIGEAQYGTSNYENRMLTVSTENGNDPGFSYLGFGRPYNGPWPPLSGGGPDLIREYVTQHASTLSSLSPAISPLFEETPRCPSRPPLLPSPAAADVAEGYGRSYSPYDTAFSGFWQQDNNEPWNDYYSSYYTWQRQGHQYEYGPQSGHPAQTTFRYGDLTNASESYSDGHPVTFPGFAASTSQNHDHSLLFNPTSVDTGANQSGNCGRLEQPKIDSKDALADIPLPPDQKDSPDNSTELIPFWKQFRHSSSRLMKGQGTDKCPEAPLTPDPSPEPTADKPMRKPVSMKLGRRLSSTARSPRQRPTRARQSTAGERAGNKSGDKSPPEDPINTEVGGRPNGSTNMGRHRRGSKYTDDLRHDSRNNLGGRRYGSNNMGGSQHSSDVAGSGCRRHSSGKIGDRSHGDDNVVGRRGYMTGRRNGLKNLGRYQHKPHIESVRRHSSDKNGGRLHCSDDLDSRRRDSNSRGGDRHPYGKHIVDGQLPYRPEEPLDDYRGRETTGTTKMEEKYNSTSNPHNVKEQQVTSYPNHEKESSAVAAPPRDKDMRIEYGAFNGNGLQTGTTTASYTSWKDTGGVNPQVLYAGTPTGLSKRYSQDTLTGKDGRIGTSVQDEDDIRDPRILARRKRKLGFVEKRDQAAGSMESDEREPSNRGNGKDRNELLCNIGSDHVPKTPDGGRANGTGQPESPTTQILGILAALNEGRDPLL